MLHITHSVLHINSYTALALDFYSVVTAFYIKRLSCFQFSHRMTLNDLRHVLMITRNRWADAFLSVDSIVLVKFSHSLTPSLFSSLYVDL